jgi:hypothetical protein
MTWHTTQELDSTHFICSVEQEAAFSLTSYLDTIRLERAKSNPTQETSCSQDSVTESYPPSQSGTTYAHSTEHPGEEQLMFFAEDGLAKTYQSQEREQGSKEQGLVFGVSILDSSLKYDHESSSWKTHQCLFNEEVEELSVILPETGMMCDGYVWAGRITETVRTERDSSVSLMRPTASDGMRQKFKLQSLIRKNHGDGNLSEQLARVHRKMNTPELSETLMNWPEGWSDVKPLGTGKMLSWLQWPLEY